MSQDEVLDQIYPEQVGPILARAKKRETERLLDLIRAFHTSDPKKLVADLDAALHKTDDLEDKPQGPVTADDYEKQLENLASVADKIGNTKGAAELRRKLRHYKLARADKK